MEQGARLARALPGYSGREDPDAPRFLRAAGLDHEVRQVSWTRPVPVETHLDNLASHSYLAVLPPEESQRVLDAEREELCARFPDGIVPEAYVVDLVMVPRPEGGA